MNLKHAPEEISRIIRYAWEDRTSFEGIEQRTGLRESQVFQIHGWRYCKPVTTDSYPCFLHANAADRPDYVTITQPPIQL